MPLDPFVEYGDLKEYDVVDETGLLVMKASFKGGYKKWVEKEGPTRLDEYMRGENPEMTFDISGRIIPDNGGHVQGVVAQQIGTPIALANFSGATNIHGFDASAGKLVLLKDATRELSDSEEPQCSLNGVVKPGIAAA